MSAGAGVHSLVAGFPLEEAWCSLSDSGTKLKADPFVPSTLMNPVPVYKRQQAKFW